jgi:hypothetical protein
MQYMTPALSHVAGRTVGWMLNKGLQEARELALSEVRPHMEKVNEEKERFVLACRAACTFDRLPAWALELIHQSLEAGPPYWKPEEAAEAQLAWERIARKGQQHEPAQPEHDGAQ